MAFTSNIFNILLLNSTSSVHLSLYFGIVKSSNKGNRSSIRLIYEDALLTTNAL